jgi:hypothetical protein
MLRRQQGQAIIETALVLPLLFLVIFGTIEGGLRVLANESAEYAVHHAAGIIAAAGADPDADYKGLQELRQSVLGQTNLDDVTSVEVEQVNPNGDSVATPRVGNRYHWDRPDQSSHEQSCGSRDDPPGLEPLDAGGPTWPSCQRFETPSSKQFLYLKLTVNFNYPFRTGFLRGSPVVPEKAVAVVRIDPVFYRPVAQPPPPEEDIIDGVDMKVSFWGRGGGINAAQTTAATPYVVHGQPGAVGCSNQPNRDLFASVSFQAQRFGPPETLFHVGWLTDLNQGRANFIPDSTQPPPVVESGGLPFSLHIDPFPGYAEARPTGPTSGWFQPQVTWDDALGHHVQPSPPLSPPPGSRLYWKCVP